MVVCNFPEIYRGNRIEVPKLFFNRCIYKLLVIIYESQFYHLFNQSRTSNNKIKGKMNKMIYGFFLRPN